MTPSISIILNSDFPRLIEEIRVYFSFAQYIEWNFEYGGLIFQIKRDVWSGSQDDFKIQLLPDGPSRSAMFPPDMNLLDPLTRESLARNFKAIFNQLILVSVHSG